MFTERLKHIIITTSLLNLNLFPLPIFPTSLSHFPQATWQLWCLRLALNSTENATGMEPWTSVKVILLLWQQLELFTL